MPVSYCSSPATLRRARSIPANILRSAKTEEDQQFRPEVARQYALAAANQAFHQAQTAKAEEEANKTPKILKKHTLRLTDDTLVNTSPFPNVDDAYTVHDDTRASGSNVKLIPEPAAPAPSPTQPHQGSIANAIPSARKVSGTSSFQRMSKPRSMFSLRKKARLDTLPVHGSAGRETPTLRRSMRRLPAAPSSPGGLSPKKAPPTAEELLQRLPNRYQTTYNQDLAVQLAREEYFRQMNEQNSRSVQSDALKDDLPRAVNHFRHSFRRNEDTQEDNASTHDGCLEQNTLCPRPRSRRFSEGFRATLRRIFRGSPSQGFPAQQIDATRKHYDSTHEDDSDPEDPIRYPFIPEPSPEMVARLSRRQSNDTVVPSSVTERHSVPLTIRSVRSIESLRSGSRVTSWTNSVASKGTQMSTSVNPQSSDLARLSVIREHASPRPLSYQVGTLPRGIAIGNPMSPLRNLCDLDTEKMAEGIRENIRVKCEAARSETLPTTSESMSTADGILDDKFTRHRLPRSALRPTRADFDDEPLHSPQLQMRKRRGITFPSSEDDDVFEPSVPRLRRQVNGALHHKLSLQDIANLNEGHGASAQRSLRESRSTFFPGKSQYPKYQPSPHHQAMRAMLGRATVQTPLGSRDSTPVDSQDSASVYSRKTTGTPDLNGALDEVDAGAIPGTAYIHENPVYHYRSLAEKARTAPRAVSHRSSGSWKGWMASEVSKLEGDNDYNSNFYLSQNQPGFKGIGHVRESAERGDTVECLDEQNIQVVEEEDNAEKPEGDTTRSSSGSRPALDAVRFFSGLRLPKRRVSNESKDTASRRGSFSIKEDSDAASSKSRLRVMLPSLRTSSNGSDSSKTRKTGLSHKVSESALKLPTVPESPMTPFSKFMASNESDGGSPLDGYHLRERAANNNNTCHSPERDARLRRIQSSGLASKRGGRHGPSQYPWLQRYRDSHFYEELSTADQENSPCGYDTFPSKDQENTIQPHRAYMEDDAFSKPSHSPRRIEHSSSGEAAFI